jgi:hypothetical protein
MNDELVRAGGGGLYTDSTVKNHPNHLIHNHLMRVGFNPATSGM